jgi:hypothetical protein
MLFVIQGVFLSCDIVITTDLHAPNNMFLLSTLLSVLNDIIEIMSLLA